MSRFSKLVSIALLLLLSACVSKSRFEAVSTELEECKRDKVAAQDSARSCEERFQAESAHWESIGKNVEEALPKALQEFQSEREKIVKMVPQQMRSDLEKYLDGFAKAVHESFGILRDDNQKMMTELQSTKTELQELKSHTASIDTAVGTRLTNADAAHADMAKRAADLIQQIQEWDRATVNDRKSDTRLHLNRKERETITLFHDQLVKQLNELATDQGPAATGEPAPAEPAPMEPEPTPGA